MGYLYAFSAAIIWGSGGLFIKMLSGAGMSAASIVIIRGMLVAALISVCCLFNPRLFKIDKKDALFIALAGVNLIIGCQGLFIYSMTLAGMALTTVLHYTAPAFVIIVSFFAFKEPITINKALALVSSLAGLVFVVGLFDGALNASAIAIIAGTASGLGYGLHTVFFKHLMKKYDSLTANLWAMIFGVSIAGALSLPFGGLTLPSTTQSWLYLFLLSLGPGFLSFYLFAKSLKYVEAGRASIIATIEPVSAAVFGYIFLLERISLSQFLGMALVILASILSSRKTGIHATANLESRLAPGNAD